MDGGLKVYIDYIKENNDMDSIGIDSSYYWATSSFKWMLNSG